MDEQNEQRTGAREGAFLLGLALLAAGCWHIYPPLSAVVPGALLIAVAVFGVR